MCYQVRFITRSVKCIVTMRWVLGWLGNGFGCSVKDERTCTMRREVGVHLWWIVILCVRSTKVRDDRRFTISVLSLHFPQISRTPLYAIVSSHLGYRRPHSMRWVYKNLCPATISASIMAVNMGTNSLKNVESDNNKVLYETLLDFFLQRNGTYFLTKPRILCCLSNVI